MPRTYTLQDLQKQSLSELHTLRGALLRTLAAVSPGTDACRDTLLNIAAVDQMIRRRAPGPRPGF